MVQIDFEPNQVTVTFKITETMLYALAIDLLRTLG